MPDNGSPYRLAEILKKVGGFLKKDSGSQLGEFAEKPFTLITPEAKLTVHFPFRCLILEPQHYEECRTKIAESGRVILNSLHPFESS